MQPRSSRIALTLALLSGCGGVTQPAGDDETPDAGDIDVDAGDLQACDLSQPFGELAPVAGVNSGLNEEFATLSPDELTIYFSSDSAAPNTPNFAIHVATRTSRDQPFGAPSPLEVVNSDGDDRSPSISADGLALFFHSSRTGDYDVYVSTRSSTTAPFGAPMNLGAGVNTTGIEGSPVISSDGETLYFDRPDADGVSTVWRATRAAAGFGSATPLASLGAPSSYWATPSADGLTLFFASSRPGGWGEDDAYVATRGSTAEPFGAIENVAELNTPGWEAVDWVSPDGCRIYITQWNATTYYDVLEASRPR